MFAQLAHGPHVTLLSALGQTTQLQTLDHSLAQFGHGYTSDGKVEQPAFLDRKRRAVFQKCSRNGLARENDRVIERKLFICAQRLVQQIVGRERRERLSQLAWCGGGCFNSRRRVNFYEAGSGQVRFGVDWFTLLFEVATNYLCWL